MNKQMMTCSDISSAAEHNKDQEQQEHNLGCAGRYAEQQHNPPQDDHDDKGDKKLEHLKPERICQPVIRRLYPPRPRP